MSIFFVIEEWTPAAKEWLWVSYELEFRGSFIWEYWPTIFDFFVGKDFFLAAERFWRLVKNLFIHLRLRESGCDESISSTDPL